MAKFSPSLCFPSCMVWGFHDKGQNYSQIAFWSYRPLCYITRPCITQSYPFVHQFTLFNSIFAFSQHSLAFNDLQMLQILRPPSQYRAPIPEYPRYWDHSDSDEAQKANCPREPQTIDHLYGEEGKVGGDDEAHER